MKLKKLKTFRSFATFSKWTKEEQATYIERASSTIIKNLNELKKNLQMYGEISDEIYNLSPSEIRDYASSYVSAVRGGEITTPSSKRAYQHFIEQLKRYSRRDIKTLARLTANRRIESWLETIRSNGSLEEIAYAEQLVKSMTTSQKIGFTRSSYFLDTETWNYDAFRNETDEGIFSIQTLKLELYLQSQDVDTKKIYNRYIAKNGDVDTKRKGTRKGQRKRRK